MDDIKAQYETNVFGLIRTTQGVLPTMMHLNDVAVEKDSKLLYYQIKSTTNSSLSRADIIDSL